MAKKIQVLDIPLNTKAGALAQVLGGLREAKINLTSVWGYEIGSDKAQAHLYTQDLDKARKTLEQMGLKPTVNTACWVEGDDKIGVYQECLAKVAKAGINLHATDGIGIGGKFAAILWVDQKDVDKLSKALGC